MSSTPTICLNMIVKNEAKIIERFLTSIVSIIDTYCICDTGSTDNTIDVINSFFEKIGMDGVVVSEPFKNFQYNRNYAISKCLGLSDYILVLDADMVLKHQSFDKNILLSGDAFNILQGSDDFSYVNTRIFKNNGLYNYIGVTHEYISRPPDDKVVVLEKNVLFISDIGDGGCKQNKFERDIKLLTGGIVDEPNNERYHFYLANSYYDSGRYYEAIDWYKKRIALNGWEQEIWYSYYKIGICYKQLNKMGDAIKSWLDAYDYFPTRIENIYEIINYYRNNSNHKLASLFYGIALKILEVPMDRINFLFLHNHVYTYNIYYEYTIFAYYLGIRNINNEVVRVLNNCDNNSTISCLLRNMKFYKFQLEPTSVYDFSSSKIIDINSENTVFNSSSSCIIRNPYCNGNGYIVNSRFVNYVIDSNGKYHNCDKHIISTNKCLFLTFEFEIVKEHEFEVEFKNEKYIGIEDIRIFQDEQQNVLKFIGTKMHSDDKLGIVTGVYDVTKKHLEYIELKSSFSNEQCEKNWTFVPYKGCTHVIYKWHPLQICKINEDTRQLNMIESKETPRIFSQCRGSTCGTMYNNEIWFIVHIVSYESPRHYYHIIAVFDSDLNISRYSAPVTFESVNIEYSIGLIVEKSRVIISYSVMDNSTKIGVYDKSYIDALLMY